MRLRGWIAVAAVALTALAVGSVATAGTHTSTRIYGAFTASGQAAIHVTKTVKGYCFAGSLEADRNDAWRCLSKNFLYDPCFSSSKAKGIVLCPAAAWKRSGLEIKLTKGLPTKFGSKRAPSTKGRPWAMETFSGLKCALAGMGPIISPRVVGDYACKNPIWLWGRPNRKTQPWTIYVAPAGATKLTTKAKIWIAWF
jgi:hypothetical protein